ncbi:MAG: monovalent cation/H+ antiporter subunit D [Halothiobacillaceae bacterium]|jgi:multicomponent K+:H+ antiporter subunit D|nr:monovalent cation/H+ antiporter subunit D [Halothiobacillaceae bacterium]HQS01620.1 monovalent cation/H+ antiporter subunit D [Halothiobacillus sp.]HQS28197.1 monovalent cation/H+ antiporter subunit D [Halothiobacillus sp.]HUM99352.1 monovalent cation/H+ antiporter subunit D [Halothiobacillus sp.]
MLSPEFTQNMALQLLALPVFLPILSAITLIALHRAGIQIQRIISGASVSILLICVVYLLASGAGDTAEVYPMGDWPAPFGIVWVYDRLSGLMLLLTALLGGVSFLYAIATDEDKKGAHFHALFQAQLFGLNGAFLTGDVFNLFVFFEVLLLASYGLMLHGGGAARSRAGLHYIVINLIGSTIFLFAVGALYGVLGTLNLADLAVKISQAPASTYGLIAAASFLLFVVFAIKAAAFPLYLWLPGTYAETSAPVAALFAIMTKVGLYAMLRVHGTLFNELTAPMALINLIDPWMLLLGLLTLIMATFGVLAAINVRRQVAYLVLASVGTLMIALGINTQAALTGGLYYWIHTTLMTAGFFLLAGQIVRTRGDQIGETHPPMPQAILAGSLFLAYAIGLAGLPPLTGFFGKTMILFAALANPLWVPIYATVLISSVLMVVALARSGSALFYRVEHAPAAVKSAPINTRLSWAAVSIPLGLVVLMVIASKPITHWLTQTSIQIHDTPRYIQRVLHPTPTAPGAGFAPHPLHDTKVAH